MPDVVPTPLRLIHAGARRGAEALLPYLAEHQRDSAAEIRATYVDPVPGRALTLSRKAAQLGLLADHRESSIEDFFTAGFRPEPRSVFAMNLDTPGAIARAARLAEGMPAVAYGLWLFPTGHLAGFQAVIAAGRQAERERFARLFDTLAPLAARSGSEAVIGSEAAAAHRVSEPVHRRTFSRHLRRNLPKIASGLEPEDAPFQLVFDGRRPEPALLLEETDRWQSPGELIERIPEVASAALAPGQTFLLLETGPDGLRIHRGRFRKLDRRVEMTTVTGIDPRIVAAARAERERAFAGALRLTD